MKQYTIGGITFSVSGNGLNHIPGFSVFSSIHSEKQDALIINLGKKTLPNWNLTPSYCFQLRDISYELAFDKNKSFFYKMLQADGNLLLMEMYLQQNKLYVNTNMDEHTPSHLLSYALWLAFGVFSVSERTVSIHASTIIYKGKSFLFLGESGTGKSTHTRLWLKHIPDTELLNDDSPFVYTDENEAIAFGSPWSGKTPCFKNKQASIAGIIRLSQAPHNKIKKLSTLSAIGALLPSCPPEFAIDEFLSERIYNILSSLIQQVPVYSLECLPDKNAAQLVFSTLKNDGFI